MNPTKNIGWDVHMPPKIPGGMYESRLRSRVGCMNPAQDPGGMCKSRILGGIPGGIIVDSQAGMAGSRLCWRDPRWEWRDPA